MHFLSLVAISLALQAGTEPAAESPTPDYALIADEISNTIQAHHYNPDELALPAYQAADRAMHALAERARSDDEFLAGFEDIWDSGPFSHVDLRRSDATAEQMAAYLDTMRVGGGGAQLGWSGSIAILTVNTMMGLDTIEEIDQAYDDIAARPDTTALIIDLRQNGGGAFAIKPLVEHLLEAPFDAGAFVSQDWNADMDRGPVLADVSDVEPWQGWSIRTFWAYAVSNRITRVQFQPAENGFHGSVYVLTSGNTASAAELAADALSASGRATLIGENTAGEMLSQSIFDLPGGFQLYLPIADYFSFTNGRIEGHGVVPHIETPADQAMTVALEQVFAAD